jgi:7-cyano-7-deazaguanine synthase in queuosine biosynthesis
MTDYLLRTDPFTATAPAPARTLDWAPGSPAATVAFGTDFLTGWRPSPTAGDLLAVASVVYAIDKIEPRDATADAWTRTINLLTPSRTSLTAFSAALNFLSGDHWTVTTRKSTVAAFDSLEPLLATDEELAQASAVALFSGGLDSLCGAIDFLEEYPEKRLVLVSHYDQGKATSRQPELFDEIASHYPGRVAHRRLWLSAPTLHSSQKVPIYETAETSTRARSFLFISAAAALANAIGPTVPVLVPENGYIALNVPLTRARNGSSSTRTTHPHYFALLSDALRSIGIRNTVRNPYEFKTKGEMLEASANPDLLGALAPRTISCSHPEVARWVSGDQGNCGYCFPCLIRRASLARLGWDSPSDVWWDALSDSDLLTNVTEERGRDLRAVVNAAFSTRPDSDLLRNAPLPPGTHAAYLDVWRRGTAELRSWLTDGATGALAKVVARLSR